MEPPRFRVIVVRAWREADGLRVRLLADGDPARHWVVSSIEDARNALGELLAELLTVPSPPDPPQSAVTGPDTPC